MRRADKVRELLSKSVQEKYLKQLHLFEHQLITLHPVDSSQLQAKPAQMPVESSKSIAQPPVSAAASTVLDKPTCSTSENSKSVVRPLTIPKQISGTDQYLNQKSNAPPLFQLQEASSFIPLDVQLIIANFVGIAGMLKAASTSRSFNNLKCTFFTQKNRVPTNVEIISFVEKKQIEFESLQKQLSKISNQSSCKKSESTSLRGEKQMIPQSTMPQSEAIEIALYWLLIQLIHLSTMTARVDILRSIAFVFHDTYLCLQQNYNFTLGAEIDFKIHSIGLRAEAAAIWNWDAVVGQRSERQHRLLDRFEGFYKILTNNAHRVSIAEEVFTLVKSYKDKPEFGVNISTNRKTAETEWQRKDYDKKIKLYYERWEKNVALAKAMYKKQLKSDACNNNGHNSNHLTTHAEKEKRSFVFRL